MSWNERRYSERASDKKPQVRGTFHAHRVFRNCSVDGPNRPVAITDRPRRRSFGNRASMALTSENARGLGRPEVHNVTVKPRVI